MRKQFFFAYASKLITAFVFATKLVQFFFFPNSKCQAPSHLLCTARFVSDHVRNPEDRFSQTGFLTKRFILCFGNFFPFHRLPNEAAHVIVSMEHSFPFNTELALRAKNLNNTQ